jgi:hypothetical protein
MKKGLLILLVALVAGIAAFYVTRNHHTAKHAEVLLDSMPELAWLRGELKLTDEQFAKASELHVAYRPVCAEMCANIATAHARLESVAQTSRGMTPELEQAIREHARVHAECQQKMLRHLYQTAGLLDDKQAASYLKTMIPHALDSTTGSAALHTHH